MGHSIEKVMEEALQKATKVLLSFDEPMYAAAKGTKIPWAIEFSNQWPVGAPQRSMGDPATHIVLLKVCSEESCSQIYSQL